MKFLEPFFGFSSVRLRVVGGAAVIGIGVADYAVGREFSFALLYIIPVVFVTWYDGKKFGRVTAVLAAACWFVADTASGTTPHFAIAVWNAVSRLMILGGAGWMLSEIRESHLARFQSQIERYVRIVETFIEGVIALDKDGIIRHANGRAATLLGYSEGELTGKRCADLLGDETSRQLLETRYKSVQQEEMGPLEIRFLRKHGGSLWALVNSGMASGRREEDPSIVLLLTDISERKRAEEEARRQYLQVSAMQELWTELARSIQLESRLEIGLKTVLGMTKFDAGAIYLLEEGSKRLRMRHQKGIPAERAAALAWCEPGQGIAGQVVRSGVAQFFEDVGSAGVDDPRIPSLNDIRGLASIPLVSKNEVLGVLEIMRKDRHQFSMDQKAVLRTFGKQIGVGLENASLYEAARNRERQVRRLSIDMVRIQEEERKRFARELHDGLAQLLTTMRVNTELALAAIGERNGKSDEHLREVIIQILEAEQEAKQISHDLRPAILDDFGLKAALEVLARNFRRRAGISVDLHLPDADQRFDSVIEITIYRIVQELLANVGKHSGASLVTIQLLVRSNVLALTVADNGKGFCQNGKASRASDRVASGLRNMRERAESLNGVFRIESAPGRGTECMVEVPCTLIPIEAGTTEKVTA